MAVERRYRVAPRIQIRSNESAAGFRPRRLWGNPVHLGPVKANSRKMSWSFQIALTHKSLSVLYLDRDAWSIFFLQDCLGLDRNPTPVRNRALFC